MNTPERNAATSIIFKVLDDAERKISAIAGFRIQLKISNRKETIARIEASEIILQQIVCDEFRVSWSDILDRTRREPIASARLAYCYLAYKILGKTLASIGRGLNNRHHTTVLAAKRSVSDLMDIHDDIEKKIQNIEKRFYEDYDNA